MGTDNYSIIIAIVLNVRVYIVYHMVFCYVKWSVENRRFKGVCSFRKKV